MKYLVRRLCLLQRLKTPELIFLIESYLLDNLKHAKLNHNILLSNILYVISSLQRDISIIYLEKFLEKNYKIGTIEIRICPDCHTLIYYQHKCSNSCSSIQRLINICCFKEQKRLKTRV